MLYLATNPFIDAYNDSDLLGKMIFLGLIFLSVISWSVIIYKAWMTKKIKSDSLSFRKLFLENSFKDVRQWPNFSKKHESTNAFCHLYEVLKKNTLELLEISQNKPLDAQDIDFLSLQLLSQKQTISKLLEKHLYILSTVVTLAPFLGLLGTVWGILNTFSGMQSASSSMASNQQILAGLSLALTTTVIGLIDAIPALIGYNVLKNEIFEFDHEMQRFSCEMLSSIELQYKRAEGM